MSFKAQYQTQIIHAVLTSCFSEATGTLRAALRIDRSPENIAESVSCEIFDSWLKLEKKSSGTSDVSM